VRTILPSVFFVSLVGCVTPQDVADQFKSPRLSQLARQAKAEGKSSITTSFIPERTQSTLRDVLRDASIVIVTSTGTSRVHVFNDQIMTAQDFRVDRWLRRVPSNCSGSWPGVSDDHNLVTLRLLKGTAVLDGVRITELTQGEHDFPSGRQYLLLVRDCTGRKIELKYWSNSIFFTSHDGQILVPPFNLPVASFVRELAELKTISAFENMLKSSAPASH
jgi:hypothetical protein